MWSPNRVIDGGHAMAVGQVTDLVGEVILREMETATTG